MKNIFMTIFHSHSEWSRNKKNYENSSEQQAEYKKKKKRWKTMIWKENENDDDIDFNAIVSCIRIIFSHKFFWFRFFEYLRIFRIFE